MEYRTTQPSDLGFDNDEDVHEALQDYVQGVMTRAEPDDIMDTLVIMSNVADVRAIQSGGNRRLWYEQLSQMSRSLLAMLHDLNHIKARPDAKLEDPTLYFPEIDGTKH